jgi:hypothetical protein
MLDSKQHRNLPFLTTNREHNIRQAILAANARQQTVDAPYRHIAKGVPKSCQTSACRGWMIAFIKEVIEHDADAKQRNVGGVEFIQFDSSYMVYFRKIDHPDILPPEPKLITKARAESQQLSLELEGISFPQDIPLRDLNPILCGYILRGQVITDLYLYDLNNDLRDHLEIVPEAYAEDSAASAIQKPVIRLKLKPQQRDSM